MQKPLRRIEEAQSPFLPGTKVQFAWDSTSLELAKRCPELYHRRIIQCLETEEESIHLRYGREVHQACHDYELAKVEGADHEEALHVVVRKLHRRTRDFNPTEDNDGKAGKYKNRDFLFRSVIWYLDHWRNDPARTVILSNGKPALEVSFNFELDFGPQGGTRPYVLCGHLDRICDWNGDLFVMDRKTTTWALGPHFFRQFDMSNQMTLYSLAGSTVLSSPIRGVIIDAMQMQVNETKFERGVTYRNEARLVEWLRDLRWHLAEIESCARADVWPRRDTSCDKYGGCAFLDVCSKSPQVREKFVNASFRKGEQWNPLQPRG